MSGTAPGPARPLPPRPILVALAAGLGRRYGGDKQLAGLGPNGEWLLEYAVEDALAAGFGRVVAVVRADLRDAIERRLAARIGARAELACVVQSNADVPAGCAAPAGRDAPLGTGHALWCCRARLDAPFAVVNADDWYGPAAYRLLAAHFAAGRGAAMVGFRLARTLSAHGGVNRGVCAVTPDGRLAGVAEVTGIRAGAAGLAGRAADGATVALPADAIVSLNCWGLLPDVLPTLERGLREFLAGGAGEYYLPAAIDRYVAGRGRRLAVLESPDAWLGLTYAEDRAAAAARLPALAPLAPAA